MQHQRHKKMQIRKKKILYVPATPKNPVMIPTMNHVFSFLYLCCYQQLIYYPSGLTVWPPKFKVGDTHRVACGGNYPLHGVKSINDKPSSKKTWFSKVGRKPGSDKTSLYVHGLGHPAKQFFDGNKTTMLTGGLLIWTIYIQYVCIGMKLLYICIGT